MQDWFYEQRSYNTDLGFLESKLINLMLRLRRSNTDYYIIDEIGIITHEEPF
jgi:hypothetical protein